MDAVAAQALPLHVVDELVAFQRVLPVVHLHMQRGEPLAGPVFMDQQVVIAQDFRLGGDVVQNFLPQLWVNTLA